MMPADPPSANLVAHAQLWVFAECYDIAKLRQLSLYKLHRDLCAFDLGRDFSKAVADAIEYAYSEVSADGKEEKSAPGQELRELLLAYAVCRADVLVDSEEFFDLLQRGSNFAGVFARAVVKRGSHYSGF